MFEDELAMPSADPAEHHARVERCYDFGPLMDGARVIFALPAFDFRNGQDNNYGQHSAELVFAKRKGDLIISTTFYTGWSVDGSRVIMDGRDIGFMNTGLYSHFRTQKAAIAAGNSKDYLHHPSDCPFWPKSCYGELGSSLYGDVILNKLVNEGSAGVWDEIDKALDAQNGSN